jgi:hypothetical protein
MQIAMLAERSCEGQRKGRVRLARRATQLIETSWWASILHSMEGNAKMVAFEGGLGALLISLKPAGKSYSDVAGVGLWRV